jgi:hypothetical protein
MPFPPYYGRAAFDPAIITEIAATLRSQWDSDGALVAAAGAILSNDPTVPRSYDDFALAIAGILGSGGSEAEVSRYLRREEERLLGASRSTGQIRWPIARAAWRAVRGISLPPAE